MDLICNALLPLIGERVNHYQSLEENVNKLKRKCGELNCRKEDLESKMKTELKPGKKLKKEVELWLSTVQRINDERQSIEKQVVEGSYLERSRLGNFVAEKIQEIEELHQKGSFSDGLVVDAPPRKGAILPTTKLTGETTAKRKMEEIWACLINDDVRKIGVYGMGGSGKTTIIKHINNLIIERTDKFDSIIWVTVSKALNLKKLQNDIASALNVDISKYEDETTRAAELFDILREKKRYLLILDAMWEAFHLEIVGIPEPTLDNGCKILLTTRSRDVCRRMNCKDIKVELLSEGEAWDYFLDNVGHDVLRTPGLEQIARLVAKEYACLPLAITTIAGSIKSVDDECEWRNSLEELRKPTEELNEMGKVLGQLKCSYDCLKDVRLQHCLLYCALYPKDCEIKRKELIEYLIVEGIIEETSRQAEFDKGHSILNKLENACLLESCTNAYKEKCVKMHDLIRDMALWIKNRGFMVKAGVRLRDLPDEEQWTEDLERVSFMDNNISEVRSGASPRCSKLSTLLLLGNKYLKRIPGSFFVHMHKLGVLDLSYSCIDNLPNSISDLENLTALLLRWCSKLKYVPSLAKLRALRKLDLGNSGIIEVPQGMEMLVNLRCLDLKAKFLKMLPVGILPKLSHLQCLIVWWGSETLKVKGEEVANLRKLETFVGQVYSLHDFNIYARSLQGRRPSKYILQVGPGDPDIDFDEGGGYLSKYVGLTKCSIIRGGEALVLPKDIGSLMIKECHDVSSLCDISSSSFSYCTPLQSLEVLWLDELQNFRVLQNLEEIYVRNCEGMEEIIAAKEEEEEEEEGGGESSNHSIVNNNDAIITITLPKLRTLHLENLPELKSIVCSRAVMVCDSLQDLTVYKCPKLKRLPLSLPMLNGQPSPPPSLRRIDVNDTEWWESLEWDHPTTKDVLQSFLPWQRQPV